MRCELSSGKHLFGTPCLCLLHSRMNCCLNFYLFSYLFLKLFLKTKFWLYIYKCENFPSLFSGNLYKIGNNSRLYRGKKLPKTKPAKQTKQPNQNPPNLKFFSESQMPKENSVVYVGANHGRGIWSQSVLLLVCCRKQFYNTPFYVDLKCIWVPGSILKCCSIIRAM